MPGFGPSTTASTVDLSLRNSGLPPRPRAALEALFAVASSTFERYLQSALTEFEQHLFRLADQARSNNVQQQHLEVMREVRRTRADAAPRFLLKLEHALASIDHPGAPRAAAPAKRSSAKAVLSLIDEDIFEEKLTLQEIATRAELKYAQLLYLLGQRFGVMAGRQAFEAEELPLGPTRLCQCLSYAVECLDLNQEYRFQLYRVADRVFFGEAEPLFELFNEVLVQHRILPNVGFHLPGSRRESDGAHQSAEAAAIAEAAQSENAEGVKSPVEPAPVLVPPPELPPAFRNPQTGWPGAPRKLSPYDPNAEDTVETFENLRSLLALRRPASAKTDPANKDAPLATHDDLDVVLRELQVKPMAPIVIDGRPVARTVNHLRRDVMNYLRQLSPQGAAPQLSSEDSDAIDLLGLIFDQLAQDQRADSPMQQLLTRLQVPVVRIALRDKRFFTRKDHPARQLLNSVAEASLYWLDEETQDRDLMERMSTVVERAGTEFEGDIRVFEDLTGDLSRQIGTLVRKSEVAERRHVEAAKGREKLESARAAATAAINERVSRHSPPALLRTLLEQAWADVLALTILRHTEGSEIYRKRVKIVDRLIEMLENAGTEQVPTTPESIALRGEVESGLKQIGYHDRDIASLTARLFKDPQTEEAEDPASVTELTLQLKSRSRLGGDSHPARMAPAPVATASGEISGPATAYQAPQVAPLNEDEKRARANLLTLPFGSWFEFKINQQGETVRRKLAWYSTVSGNCLFVNQRGARTEERTLDQLARELVRGNVSVVEANPKSLLERKWESLVDSLKTSTIFGRRSQPKTVTAS